MNRMTLDQQRAEDAWNACRESATPSYRNLAKSMPALIMNSGLMQTLAFLHEKSSKDRNDHHAQLERQLSLWLNKRFPALRSQSFEDLMNRLMHSPSADYQQMTIEVLAWLKWCRQFAGAVEPVAPKAPRS